jgi:probable HAF family extracellular repeat protein
MHTRSSFLLLSVLLSAASGFAQAPKYTINDLGPAGNVTGININGQVIGWFAASGGQSHAFRTAPNAPINIITDDLGTLGGVSSVANGINASGQVTGSSDTPQGDTHGFRTGPAAKINPSADDLGTLGGHPAFGSAFTSGAGINDSGQVVGGSIASDGSSHGFRTAANSPINPATDDIGTLPFGPVAASTSGGRSINRAGVVLGAFEGGNIIFPTAFLDSGNSITEIPCIIVAPFGNNFTGINDQGIFAGTDNCSQTFPPFIALVQNGTITDMAQCDCEPHGINNSSQVVGQGFTFGPNHAFLYSGGTLYDLNNLFPSGSGWVVSNATAINDHGQIVGMGTLNGARHGFRLDPLVVPQANITSSVTVSYSGFRMNLSNGHYRQTVTLTNNSGSDITALDAALDNLAGATLTNLTGTTSSTTPANSPYISMGTLPNGQTTYVSLDFVKSGTITYTLRLLGGAGTP